MMPHICLCGSLGANTQEDVARSACISWPVQKLHADA